VCKTPAGGTRLITIITTISATDNAISFDETGQYQFFIQGENCTASVRRTRSFTLISRDGETAPATPGASAPGAGAAPKSVTPSAPSNRCARPGAPERLEVRPSRKLMRPGESFAFRTSVLDAQGCRVPLTPTWKPLAPAPGITVGAGGEIEVKADAREALVELEVAVGQRAVRVEVEIASNERYDALLQQRGLNAEGESSEAAVARVASGSIGARSAVAGDAAQTKGRLLVAVAGGTAVLLGVLGFVLVWRGRRKAAPGPAPPFATALAVGHPDPRSAVPYHAQPLPQQQPSLGDAVSTVYAGPGFQQQAQPAASAPPRTKQCPTCREEYPPEAEFCARDGNYLVAAQQRSDVPGVGGGICPICGHGYDPGVSVCPRHREDLIPATVYTTASAPPPMVNKICPVCGAQYPGESQFCGRCGASLVPVN
jgi:hypothetical protein